MIVCFNGEFVAQEQAHVSISDRGFLYGDTVYETLRSHRGEPVFWDEHFVRLRRSCELVEMEFDPADFGLEQIVREVLRRNALAEARIRLTFSRGSGDPDQIDGFVPTWVVTATPLRTFTEAEYTAGISVVLTDVMRRGNPEAKTGNYLPNLLARRQARLRGAREGILRNGQGHLTEGASTNLFWVRDGVLETPSVASGILHGVTRAKILEVAGAVPGLRDVREVEAGPDVLRDAQEIFLTSTTWEAIGVSHWEDRPVGTGRAGPISQLLRAELRKLYPLRTPASGG